jgi:hypothetical protein
MFFIPGPVIATPFPGVIIHGFVLFFCKLFKQGV